MIASIAQGLLIPFAGTSLGSACVFFLRKTLNKQIQRALTGFAAGVMVAASIWSLLLPAIEQSESMGKLSFIPAVVGFWIGIFFLLFLDHVTPHLHLNSKESEGPKKNFSRTTRRSGAFKKNNDACPGSDLTQYTRGNGSWSCVCRMDKRRFKYHSYECTYFITRHCNSKFPRRSNYFNAA